MITLQYNCTFALLIFRLHKLGIEAHAYAHYISLLYFALLSAPQNESAQERKVLIYSMTLSAETMLRYGQLMTCSGA